VHRAVCDGICAIRSGSAADLIWQVNRYDPPQVLPEPKIINLRTDLKEERGVLIPNDWVIYPIMKIRSDPEESLKKYPPIKMGTPDPYYPSK